MLVSDGECRGKYATGVQTYYDEAASTAVSKCNETQGKPVIVHNEEVSLHALNYFRFHHSASIILDIRSHNEHYKIAHDFDR